MATTPGARQARFARFIDRALKQAKESGFTIPQIEERTGVSKTTLYRWRSGDWSRDPRASEVRAFCEGLGIPPAAAYRLLGWEGEPSTSEPDPQLPPDFQTVLRRLRDPNVPEAEKQEIRTMMRYLARHRAVESGQGT